MTKDSFTTGFRIPWDLNKMKWVFDTLRESLLQSSQSTIFNNSPFMIVTKKSCKMEKINERRKLEIGLVTASPDYRDNHREIATLPDITKLCVIKRKLSISQDFTCGYIALFILPYNSITLNSSME